MTDDDGSTDTLCQDVVVNNVVPDLHVTLLAGPDGFCPSWNLHYQLRIQNVGVIPLEHLYITDVLPLGVCCPVDKADTGLHLTFNEPLRRLTWYEASLAPGEIAVASFTVHSYSSLVAGQQITNTLVYRGGKMLQSESKTAVLTVDRDNCGSGGGGLPTLTPTATVEPTATPEPTATATPLPVGYVCVPLIMK